MADNHTVARPYAEAAFELAREQEKLDTWGEALALVAELTADGRVAKFLANPRLTDEQRLAFLTGLIASAGGEDSVLAGLDRYGANFLKLLVENERVYALPEIAEHYDALKDAIENTVEVTVTSATELSAEQKRSIVAALKERLGREVQLDTALDESLIGGAVIRAGDVVIDGSLRSRLTGLANALTA
jgi:F-type H+-transporting ATPase subunit delta